MAARIRGPAVAVQPQLRAGRLRPSAHAADGVRLRAAVCAGRAPSRSRHVVKDWQINGIASWLSGRPFTIGGDNGLLQQSGRLADDQRDRRRRSRASARPDPTRQWYDPAAFAQPGNAWGNSGRNQFRGPSNWNLDASLFRTIPFGHYRLEIRAESQNVFNHAQWGNPVTGFTDPNFMRIRTLARAPRTVQLGARFVF